MDSAKLQVKRRECAVLQGLRLGNNWKPLTDTQVNIQGELILELVEDNRMSI